MYRTVWFIFPSFIYFRIWFQSIRLIRTIFFQQQSCGTEVICFDFKKKSEIFYRLQSKQEKRGIYYVPLINWARVENLSILKKDLWTTQLQLQGDFVRARLYECFSRLLWRLRYYIATRKKWVQTTTTKVVPKKCLSHGQFKLATISDKYQTATPWKIHKMEKIYHYTKVSICKSSSCKLCLFFVLFFFLSLDYSTQLGFLIFTQKTYF